MVTISQNCHVEVDSLVDTCINPNEPCDSYFIYSLETKIYDERSP